jgi:hypothetical protein
MSLYTKLRGTIDLLFQIGLGGPQLQNASGVLKAVTAAGTALAPTCYAWNSVTVASTTYAAKAGDVILVSASTGNAVINLPALNPGEFVTIIHDAATSLATNTVTINGPGGTNIQQPLPAATAFAANYVLNLVEQQGSSYVWGNLGSSGGYSLGPS